MNEGLIRELNAFVDGPLQTARYYPVCMRAIGELRFSSRIQLPTASRLADALVKTTSRIGIHFTESFISSDYISSAEKDCEEIECWF